MTLRQNTFEGTASGTTLTAANSSSGGNAFDLVSTSGTVTGVFSNAQAMHGTQSLYVSGASGSTFFPRYAGWSTTQAAARVYFRLNAINASAQNIAEFRDTAGATIGALGFATDGRTPQIKPKSGSSTNLTIFNAGVWYRIEMEIAKGTGTTDGTLRCRIYLGDDTTPISGSSYAVTNVDTGTVNVGTFVAGKTTSGATLDAYLDDMAANDGTLTAIGPVATNVAPSASAGAAQVVAAGSTVTLAGTDSDSDGTVTSRAWSVVSFPVGGTSPTLSNATTANASFVAATAGRYVMQYQVTDNNGATSTASQVTIYVYPATGQDVTVYSDTAGSWTKYGSGTSTLTSVNDTDDTTGIQSPINPAGQLYSAVLNPIGPGDIKLYVTGRWTDAAVSRQVTLYKEDGSTMVGQWTMSPTSSIAEQLVSVSSAGLAAVPTVADRRALVLTIGSTVAN